MSREEFSGLLTRIQTEFDRLETFIEPDSDKSERFKGYLKTIYDFLKIQDSRSFVDTNDYAVKAKTAKSGKAPSSSSAAANGENRNGSAGALLPELIVDRRLVDQEQIYQQLQLYNQVADSALSVDSMTQFFSKCITRLDALSMNVETTTTTPSRSRNGGSVNGGSAGTGGATTDNLDDSTAEADEEEEEDSDDYDDDDDEEADERRRANGKDESDDDDDNLSDDSVGRLINKSKKFSLRPSAAKSDDAKRSKAAAAAVDKNKPVFGIPDGSDSEISDFDVPENGEEGDEDDDDEELENGEEEDLFGQEDGEEEDEDDEDDEEDFEGMGLEMEKLAAERKARKAAAEDIDSDEVDEDLVDLYELGDEKEVMGIGKKAKSFDEVDFDDENFGFGDDDDFEDEEQDQESAGASKKAKAEGVKKPKQEGASKDLFDVDDGDDDAEAKEGDLEGKSSFEIRQMKLKGQIDEIHDAMLKGVDDKAWQLKGEVSAKTRPQDSLLEEYLQFDHTTRQAPAVSAQTTEQLEALIKQRIKDKAFDDVERKVKPVEMQYEYKKQVTLDQEKSKVGLSQIYEEEYLKKQQKEQAQADGTAGQTEASNPKHDEIRKALQSLFIKLDALSNFHYTPKTPQAEVKVVSNMPSIAIEEVAPVNVADSNVLAPEEIKVNVKSLPKGKSEEDKKDKKKKLKTKKLKIKKEKVKKQKRLELEQALNPDNQKVSRELAMNKLKKQAKNMSKNITILDDKKKTKVNSALRSSTAFFQQLQEKTQTGIKKLATKNKKPTDSNSADSNKAKKLKL